MDIAAIGSAIATRFAAVTAPTNYAAIQASTYLRQKGAGKAPFVITYFNGTRDLEYAYQRRSGVADYTAIFYYSKAADIEQTDTGLQAWHDKLLDALIGQLMLGQSGGTNGVTGAYMRAARLGESTLGGVDFAVIEMPIEVEFTHAVTVAA